MYALPAVLWVSGIWVKPILLNYRTARALFRLYIKRDEIAPGEDKITLR